eukprot:TRINITY_DN7778_c0_g1_i1.p1 TRINITY_DN7778_c0_g1~~TRINITY_DN7778_c0_g1_i1.p1  ORF type:complete len:368 (+),score=13.40 TRINITY_DN7778_c0_g1_i1:25-1104(+)
MAASYRKRFTKIKHPEGNILRTHDKAVHTVDWNKDGSQLASGSEDTLISCYTLTATGLNKEVDCAGHEDSVHHVSYHPSNLNTLGSAANDCTLRIWDTRTRNKCVKSIKTKDGNLNLCWHPDGTVLAAGDKADRISFYDTRNWSLIKQKSYPIEVNGLSFDKAGDYCYLAQGDGSLCILEHPSWDIVVPSLPAHTSNCICVAFDRVGKRFASGSADASVCIFDAYEQICTSVLPYSDYAIRAVAFSHDGELFAASSANREIDLVHVASGATVHTVNLGRPSYSLKWHPKRLVLAIATEEATTRCVQHCVASRANPAEISIAAISSVPLDKLSSSAYRLVQICTCRLVHSLALSLHCMGR